LRDPKPTSRKPVRPRPRGGQRASARYGQEADPRNDATDATKQANDALLQELPFDDTTDFENVRKGFIAVLPAEVIEGEAGGVIWNPDQYGFSRKAPRRPPPSTPASGATPSSSTSPVFSR